jgi:sirohydrochlorin ferrochelatase
VSGAKAVLLVDHGSRRAEAGRVVEELADVLRAKLPEHSIFVAHLELEAPAVGEAIDRAVAGGAREVTVLPCFLAPGRHTMRDLPEIAEAAEARHPGVAVRCAAPLGAHAGVAAALLDRLSESADSRRTE